MAGLTRAQRAARSQIKARDALEYGKQWREGEEALSRAPSQVVTPEERAAQTRAIEEMIEGLVDEDEVLRKRAEDMRQAAERRERILAEAKARQPSIEALRRQNTEHVWLRLVSRLRDPENPAYRHWGGAGVTLHPTWISVDKFIEDVGLQPSPLYELVRVNRRGAFEPGNVIWQERTGRGSTPQSIGGRPKRGTQTMVEYQGRMVNLPELAQLAGIRYATLMSRWHSGKRDIEQLTLPVRANARGRSYATTITDSVSGNPMVITLKDLCRLKDRRYSTVTTRLRAGKSMTEALAPPRQKQTHEERKAKQRKYWHERKARIQGASDD